MRLRQHPAARGPTPARRRGQRSKGRRISLRALEKIRPVVRGLEGFHPKVGRISARHSGGWKKCFQALEKIGDFFPRVGKIQRRFCRCASFREYEKHFRSARRGSGPDVGNFSAAFSDGWKNFFQTLEDGRGEARSRRGLRVCGLAVSARRISMKLVQGLLEEDYLAPGRGARRAGRNSGCLSEAALPCGGEETLKG